MSKLAREESAEVAVDAEVGPAPELAQSAAWSEVTRISHDAFRVRLGGSFGQGWLASLCSGLATQRVNITRAHAMRTRNLSWIAEFTAVALPGAAEPESVPYLSLAASPGARDEQPLFLDRYSLEACYDGTLKLSVEAEDMLGLLGALLERLSSLGLYPVEMHIETLTQRAADTLWLATADGGTPPAEVREALTRALNSALA